MFLYVSNDAVLSMFRWYKSCLVVKHGGSSDLTCRLISKGETTTIDTLSYNQKCHPYIYHSYYLTVSKKLREFDSCLTTILTACSYTVIDITSALQVCCNFLSVCVALSCKAKHFLHFPIVRNWSTFVRSAPNRFIYHRALRTKRSFLATLLETGHLCSGYLRD